MKINVDSGGVARISVVALLVIGVVRFLFNAALLFACMKWRAPLLLTTFLVVFFVPYLERVAGAPLMRWAGIVTDPCADKEGGAS